MTTTFLYLIAAAKLKWYLKIHWPNFLSRFIRFNFSMLLASPSNNNLITDGIKSDTRRVIHQGSFNKIGFIGVVFKI